MPAWYANVEDDGWSEIGTYPNHWMVARDEAKAENIPEKKSKETPQPSVTPINIGPTPIPLWTFEEFQENLLKFVPYPTPPRNDLK